MWPVFIVAALIAATPQQSPPQQGSGQAGAAAGPVRQSASEMLQRAVVTAARPESLELTLAAPVQLPNGKHLGASVRPAVSAEPWFVYTRGNLCQSVISHGPMPTDATDGWKVTITERSRTAAQVVINVTWNRLWEFGRMSTNGSGGTSELTLKRNDRIPLDTITRAAQVGVCAGTTKTLELQVGRPVLAPTAPAGESPLDGLVDAELWMVHQAPNGAETVERQTIRLINGPMGFSFRSAPVDTPDGPVYIELSGQLKAVTREDGSRGLWAGLTRMVTRQSTGTTAFASTTEATVPWLVPNDVQSFELPPLQLSPGGARTGARGGGGAGGRIGTGTPPASGTGAAAGGSQSGSGAAGAGTVEQRRSSGGGAVVPSGGRTTPPGPNLLEGHRLSLRVRLSETR